MHKLFDLLFEALDGHGKQQVLVLEHANLDSDRYQSALVEAPWGEGGLALVPFIWVSPSE